MEAKQSSQLIEYGSTTSASSGLYKNTYTKNTYSKQSSEIIEYGFTSSLSLVRLVLGYMKIQIQRNHVRSLDAAPLSLAFRYSYAVGALKNRPN